MSEEKSEKPRKIFELKIHIWDDGEITEDLVEIVPQDRGAPKKWMLDRAQFIRSLKSQLTTTPDLYKDIILEHLGFKAVSTLKKAASPEPEEDSVDDDDFGIE